MNRGDLLTQVAIRQNRAASYASLDASTKARLVFFLNETHRELLSLPGVAKLRESTLSFDSVAGQAAYAFPWVAKINRVFETTNDRLLQPITLSQYRYYDVDPDQGTPDAWAWVGYDQGVAKQPSNASSVFVKSTSASDTNTCYVEGEITGGYPRAVSVTMTGTTAVNVSSAVSTWNKITKFYLNGAAVGTVTLHEDSGSGTELGQIGVGQTSQSYLQILLSPTPSSVITYTADVQLGITDLAQDTDVPRLPQDFHDLLVLGAMWREYEKSDDGRARVAEQRYQDRKRDLLYWLHEAADPMPMSPGGRGFSRLGPWFPAGS